MAEAAIKREVANGSALSSAQLSETNHCEGEGSAGSGKSDGGDNDLVADKSRGDDGLENGVVSNGSTPEDAVRISIEPGTAGCAVRNNASQCTPSTEDSEPVMMLRSGRSIRKSAVAAAVSGVSAGARSRGTKRKAGERSSNGGNSSDAAAGGCPRAKYRREDISGSGEGVRKVMRAGAGRKRPTVTIAHTPHLRTAGRVRRAQEWHGSPSARENTGPNGWGRIPKARAMPDFTLPAAPPKVATGRATLDTTKPAPFSFHTREEQLLETRAARHLKAAEYEDRERVVFQAQPLPDFSGGPTGVPRPLGDSKRTQPRPFTLITNTRGAVYQEALRARVEEEEREMREKAGEFRARPPHVLEQAPFQVEKADGVALTEPVEFPLHTAGRAVERDQWDEGARARQREEEAHREEREWRQRQREEEEVARLRETLVIPAQPIRRFAPTIIEASDKPLTQPLSPHFSTRFNK